MKCPKSYKGEDSHHFISRAGRQVCEYCRRPAHQIRIEEQQEREEKTDEQAG